MDSKVGRAVNEVIDAMVERRSCRSFKADMPSEEQLDAVVKAGLYAASGMGRQSAIILKVTDRALRDRLSALNAQVMGAPEGTDPFYGAPAVLVFAFLGLSFGFFTTFLLPLLEIQLFLSRRFW